MAMQTQEPLRVPFPLPEEIAALETIPRMILNDMESKMPLPEYKALARHLVDSSPQASSVGRVGIRYANPNLEPSSKYLGIDEHNTDRIPISTYEKMRLYPQIALATSLIELQVLAQNYRIVCEDEQIRAFVDHVVEPIYRPTTRSKLRAVQFGFACGEKVRKVKHVRVVVHDESGKKKIVFNKPAAVIERVKFGHPSSIRIIRDMKTEEIKYVTQDLEYLSGGRRKKIKRAKIVWFSPESEYGNVFGNSRYKNVYQPWYWVNVIIQFALKYFERKGAPGTVVKAPPGTSKDANGQPVDNMDLAIQAGIQFTSNSVVAMPRVFNKNGDEMWVLEQHEDKQRGGMFIEMISYLNTLIMRGMFIPDQVATSEGGGGTNATSESRTDVHMISEEALIQEIEDCWNKEIIDELVRMNFPPEKQVPCRIKIERLNFSKKTLLRDIFVRMIIHSSTALKDGMRPSYLPSIKKLADMLEIPVSDFDEIYLSEVGSGGTTDDTSSIMPSDKKDEDTPDEREQKVSDKNKDAATQRERTVKERKERARR